MKSIKSTLENVTDQLKKYFFISIHHVIGHHHHVNSQPIESADSNYNEYLKFYQQATRWQQTEQR